MTKEPTKTPVAAGKPARPMTPAEQRAAEEAEASNRKQTGGYDQTKGPSGKDEHRTKRVPDVTEDEIRDQVRGMIDGFKGRVDKTAVVNVLQSEAELLHRGEAWVRDPSTLDYDPDDLDDPRANPLGARPAPEKATRADEHTAPEPDSTGNIADRKAAEAGLNEQGQDLRDVPPPDREAVAAKRGAEKSAEQFGTAGGSTNPLSRAEHKDDPKPKPKR